MRNWPEVWIAATMIVVTALAGQAIGVPISLPQGDRAAFVGIHYLYPLIGVGILGVITLLTRRRDLAKTFFIALPCYAVVLVCHFNLKLWRPLINPAEWDRLYWSIDQALHPLVAAAMIVRQALFPIVPPDSNLYMTAFITMFYVSFCFHALRTPDKFRTVFIAALVFQSLGALAYMVMPALGPFLYETGVEPQQTLAQHGMLGSYHDLRGGGAPWVAANGGTHITVGLGAMPSLHTGGSFLFLLFAWRYARVLTPLYAVLFGFIMIDAVANRWHYLIDLPVGLGLAWFSAWAAEHLTASAAIDADADAAPVAMPSPAPLASFAVGSAEGH